MITTGFARDDVINVHLTFICTTQLAGSTITHEHAFALLSVSPTVQLI
jgi:hypothetical protein